MRKAALCAGERERERRIEREREGERGRDRGGGPLCAPMVLRMFDCAHVLYRELQAPDEHSRLYPYPWREQQVDRWFGQELSAEQMAFNGKRSSLSSATSVPLGVGKS